MAERLFAVLMGIFKRFHHESEKILGGQGDREVERLERCAMSIHPFFQNFDDGGQFLNSRFGGSSGKEAGLFDRRQALPGISQRAQDQIALEFGRLVRLIGQAIANRGEHDVEIVLQFSFDERGQSGHHRLLLSIHLLVYRRRDGE